MAEPKVDFYVIYNRAMTSLAITEDCELSLQFVEDLVKTLEDKGHKGHFADRDAIAGSNLFTELFRYTREARKIFLVVTPEFLSNCWSRYSSMAAFKNLIDTDKCDKLIPIGIGISEHQKLPELNIKDWIHFSGDWSSLNKNSRKWNIIIKALSFDGPLSAEPTYQGYIHDQEHGDNKLRTERKELVVQPNSLQDENKDFFTEKFLLEISTNFLANWEELALRLRLKDETVKEVKLNNPNNVRMQAYNALLSWKKSYGVKEENRITDLLSVLMEMGRRDLAENIEAKYNEFMRKFESPEEGVDEVDMGMSRNRGDSPYLRRTQQNEQLLYDRGNNTGELRQNETYMARELKAESAAFIDMNPHPEYQMTSLDSLELECGPSMSLPTAKVVKLPHSSKPSSEQPKNAVSTQEMNSINKTESKRAVDKDTVNKETNSNTGRPGATKSVAVDEHISPSHTSNLNQKIRVDTQIVRPPPGGKYTSQQSLSQDNDLTADTQGSFSYNDKPNSLPFHGKEDVADSANNKISHNATNARRVADVSPDSGYSGSASQTPLDEQIISSKGSQSQEAENSNNNAADATGVTDITRDSGYSGSVSQTPLDEQIIPNKGNQLQEVNCKRENSTGNEVETSTWPTTGLNKNSDEFKEQGVPDESSKSLPSENTSSISSQGQPQSLGFRFLRCVVDSMIKPELAYS